MLFRRFSRFRTGGDIERAMDTEGAHFTVFPIVDPESEGGKYLISKKAFDDFNEATANEIEIWYFAEDSVLSFDDLKRYLAERLEAVNSSIRRELHRPGFVVFFPEFERVIFWPIRIKGRAPSETDVYSVLSSLKKIATDEIYKKIGVNNLSRAVYDGIELVAKPSVLKDIADHVIGIIQASVNDDKGHKT